MVHWRREDKRPEPCPLSGSRRVLTAEAERSYPSLCRFSHVARVPGNEPRPRRVENFEFMVDVLKCIAGTRRKAELRKDLPWERAALLEHVRALLAAGKPDEAQREAGKYFEGRQQLSESATARALARRLALGVQYRRYGSRFPYQFVSGAFE